MSTLRDELNNLKATLEAKAVYDAQRFAKAVDDAVEAHEVDLAAEVRAMHESIDLGPQPEVAPVQDDPLADVPGDLESDPVVVGDASDPELSHIDPAPAETVEQLLWKRAAR